MLTAIPLIQQVGGTHYKKWPIQPVEYCMKNGLDHCQSNVVKYVTRFRDKGGLEDLDKAKHYLDLLIYFEKEKEDARNALRSAKIPPVSTTPKPLSEGPPHYTLPGTGYTSKTGTLIGQN